MINPIATLRSVVRFDRIETDPVERRLKRAANVDDLRRIAERRLPHGVFDYIDGGAEDERTLRNNRQAFADTDFNPRVLRGLQSVDTSSTVLGQLVPYPLALAPPGSPASPIPKVSSPSPAPPSEPDSPTRCPP